MTLEQCMARLRELATAIEVVDHGRPWPLKRITSHPGWIGSLHFACRVGGVPEGLATVDGTDALRFLSHEGSTLERAPELDVPTTYGSRPTTVVVEEGCDGCECGDCPGYTERTEPGPPEVVEEVGQTVYRASSGMLVVIDPKYAPLVEGLSLALVDGGCAVLGRLNGEAVSAVMDRRSDNHLVVERAEEYAAQQAPAPEVANA